MFLTSSRYPGSEKLSWKWLRGLSLDAHLQFVGAELGSRSREIFLSFAFRALRSRLRQQAADWWAALPEPMVYGSTINELLMQQLAS